MEGHFFENDLSDTESDASDVESDIPGLGSDDEDDESPIVQGPVWMQCCSDEFTPSMALQCVLEFLSRGYTIPFISSQWPVQPVSVAHIRALLRHFHIRVTSKVSDGKLKKLVIEARKNLCKNGGYRDMTQCLANDFGVHINPHRVRHLLREIEPERVQARYRNKLRRRRPYTSPGSLFCVHIDGIEKMVPGLGLYVYTAVDGYSRKILAIFACCSKSAETVELVSQYVYEKYGVPAHIRTDKGREFTKVFFNQFMNCDLDENAVWTGTSTANTRVERINGVTNGELMDLIELSRQISHETGGFDELQAYALHRVLVPYANERLQHYKRRWNSHKITGVGMPNQLFFGKPFTDIKVDALSDPTLEDSLEWLCAHEQQLLVSKNELTNSFIEFDDLHAYCMSFVDPKDPILEQAAAYHSALLERIES